MTPEQAWQRLTDWKSHGEDPDSFVAWSGVGKRLALEDRMKLVEQRVDGDRRRARIAKLGPVLLGEAEFSVSPGIAPDSAVVQWREVVTVPHLPQVLAPLVGQVGKFLFSMSLGRMARAPRR
jgi:hypothetical protein